VPEPADRLAGAPASPPTRPPALGALSSGALALLFTTALLALPVVGLVVAPLGLIPVAQYLASGRRGVVAWGWVVALLLAAAAAGLAELTVALLAAFLLLVVIPSLGLEAWLRFPWSEGRWAALTTALAAVAALLAVAVAAWPLGPVAGTEQALRLSAAAVEELSLGAGLPRGQLSLWLDAAEATLSWVLPSAPVAYLVAVLFWIRPRLPLLGFSRATGPFEDYTSEEWLPAAFAVAGAATLLLEGSARWVALNLLIAVLILYFVHGLAIIRAHLARWLGRGWLVRWGIGLLSLQLPLLVAALGLVDSFVKLRPRTDDMGRTA
jgi:hypothetical protein